MSHAFVCSIILMGGASLLLQVLLLRELLTSFFGNELAITVVLLDWLLIVAAGSRLAGRVRRWELGVGSFVSLQLALSVIAPAAVMISRAVGGRTMFPGEVVTPPLMAGLAALTVGPGCLLLGAQFAVGCRLAERADSGRGAVSRVYALEAFGALLAGAMFHFVLADRVGPVEAALGIGALSAAAAVWLDIAGTARHGRTPEWMRWLGDEQNVDGGGGSRAGPVDGGRARRLRIGIGAALGLAMLVVTIVAPARHALTRRSLEMRWRGFDLVASVNSRLGNLAVTRAESQVSLFQDGALLFTSEDIEASEWTAHLPLLAQERPGKTLLIGAGYPATAREIGKHGGPGLTVMEIDPALIALADRWLPDSAAAPEGARPSVMIGDARALLQRDDARYDAIILAAHDPSTAALNRYYTGEFFALAREHLAPGGVLAVSLAGHEAYLMAERKLIHASVYRALSEAFSEIVAVPGHRVHLLASATPGALTGDARVLARRLAERGVDAQFVNAFSLETALLPFNADMYMDAVRQSGARPNSDLHPVTHYNHLRIWLRQYAAGGLWLLSGIERAPAISHWLLLIAVIAAIAGRYRRFRARSRRIAIVTAVVGFAEMGLQLGVLLAFQALAGCLYYEMGILIALNMGGLAVGGWLAGLPWLAARYDRALPLAAGGVCLLAYGFGAILHALEGALWAVPVCLGAVALITGVLGGLAFPLAVTMLHPIGGGQARAGSILYAWDLLGGAVGAVVVGLLLIPALGFALAATVVGSVTVAGILVIAPLCGAGGRG